MTHQNDTDALRDRVQRLGFFGLLASWNEIAREPWLPQLITIEEKERKRRSLERRLRAARIGAFKAMADFDWTWPSRVDREAIDELLSLKLVDERVNAVLIGPNGVGKTMILRNIAQTKPRSAAIPSDSPPPATCSAILPRRSRRPRSAGASGATSSPACSASEHDAP